MKQVESILADNPGSMVYLVLPLSQLPQANTVNNSRLKKIILAPFEEYNFRMLGEEKVVGDNSQLYIGTYPAEISVFLKYLRYNIRKPEEQLEKQITN